MLTFCASFQDGEVGDFRHSEVGEERDCGMEGTSPGGTEAFSDVSFPPCLTEKQQRFSKSVLAKWWGLELSSEGRG